MSHVEISEARAFPGKPIYIGCCEPLGTIHADVAVALIVGEDDDNIRRAPCRIGLRLGRKDRACECEWEQRGDRKSVMFHCGDFNAS
jgi:hypothetical protein